MSIHSCFESAFNLPYLTAIDNHSIKMSKDSPIIFILYSTISNDPSSYSYFYVTIFYGENKTIGINFTHAECNFLFLVVTSDARLKDPTHFTHLTLSKNICAQNFRIASFTSHSKVRMQLLSCININFALPFTFAFYPILDSSDIVGRFITANIHTDSQCRQVKNILLNYLMF